MSVPIKSGSGSDLLTIEPTAKSARATLYPSSNTQELSVAEGVEFNANHRALLMAGVNDDNLRFLRTDRLGNVCSGLITPLFNDSFHGTTILPNKWAITNTTMLATTAPTGMIFNSGAITTINTGYLITTHKNFQIMQKAPIQAKYRKRIIHYNNAVAEFGFGAPATFNGAVPTGAYFQVTSSGALQPVLTFNGVDITGTPISYSILNTYVFDVIADDDEVHFFVQDTSTGTIVNAQSIKVPLTAQRKWSAGALPAFSRLYNTGVAPSTAPQMILGEIYVGILDTVLNKPYPYVCAGMGDGIIHNPLTGAQNANLTNSAVPANATLANATAGYTTAGGLFSFVAIAGAVTDYCLFGFQVPAGKQLFITGIDIDAWNTGAVVATTPSLLVWGLAINGNPISLASANYIRLPLGAQSFPIGAVIGAMADRTIQADFSDSPIVCESSRFCSLILRMPVGTATASQVIQGLVTIKGYYE